MLRWIAAVMAAMSVTVSAAAAEANGSLLIVIGRTLDRAQMGAYAGALPPLYAAAGGRYLGLGGPGRGATCLAGACEGRSAVVALFPDKAAMDGFWWGDEYRKAIRLRDKAGVFTVFGAPVTGRPLDDPEKKSRLLLAFSAGAGDKVHPDLEAALAKAGAVVLAGAPGDALIPYEGDAPWSRVTAASFPSQAALDAFLKSAAAKRALRGMEKSARLVMTVAPPGAS
jgi:uncharacterized protein (DUF1330 family)